MRAPTARVPRAPVGSGDTAEPGGVRVAGRLLALLLLAAAVLLLALASVAFGSRGVTVTDVVNALGGSSETVAEAAVAKRLPRTMLALLAGGSLGLAGALMQGVTRNPIADPGLLGVTMGASLAVVTAIAWFGLSSMTSYIWTAIVGAAVSAGFVYTIGSLGRGGPTPLKLALAGAATSATFASFITAVALPRADISATIRSWQIGGVGGSDTETVLRVLPFLAVGAAIGLTSARSLNSLALGDDVAAGLGERVALARGSAFLAAVLLCGAATAACGPIGFVGLVVPHLCRLLVGVDHRWLLPFSVLAGAALLTAADVLGRVVARPSEIDVGIITALVGAPFFIHVVRQRRMREL